MNSSSKGYKRGKRSSQIGRKRRSQPIIGIQVIKQSSKSNKALSV